MAQSFIGGGEWARMSRSPTSTRTEPRQPEKVNAQTAGLIRQSETAVRNREMDALINPL